jgi:hypothetical protein
MPEFSPQIETPQQIIEQTNANVESAVVEQEIAPLQPELTMEVIEQPIEDGAVEAQSEVHGIEAKIVATDHELSQFPNVLDDATLHNKAVELSERRAA